MLSTYLNRRSVFLSVVGLMVGVFSGLATTRAQSTDNEAQPAGDFKLDNEHSSLIFAVSNAGLSYTYGRFERCAGTVALATPAENSTFRFEVDAASINTNSRLRDDHLRGGDFFDASRYPKIRFTSETVTYDATKRIYIASGMLDLHGVKQKIEMPITLIGIGKGLMGKTRAGFMTKFLIKRSDFEINTMAGVIGDQVAITFSFEAILSGDSVTVPTQPPAAKADQQETN